MITRLRRTFASTPSASPMRLTGLSIIANDGDPIMIDTTTNPTLLDEETPNGLHPVIARLVAEAEARLQRGAMTPPAESLPAWKPAPLPEPDRSSRPAYRYD